MKYCIFTFSVIIFMIETGLSQLTSTFIKTLAQGTCGIPTGGPLVQQLTTTLTDTSGLFWSDNGAKICYVERFGLAFGRYTPDDGRFNRMDVNQGHEAICIFPVNNATGLKFVIGIDNKLFLANVTGSGTNLKSEITSLITVSNNGEIFTKGKVDNKGRLWYASTSSQFSRLFGQLGNLYKIENLGKPVVMERNLQMGAGMAWTKNYTSFYLVDSSADRIYKYNFDAEKGLISNKTTIFKTSEHAELDGHPHDIVIDDAGYLWIGMLTDGVVIQYDEKTKNILWRIPMAVPDIVSLEFGGLDKKTLFVGTSTKLLYSNSIKTAGTGAIFGISGLGAVGIPDNEIVIPQKYH